MESINSKQIWYKNDQVTHNSVHNYYSDPIALQLFLNKSLSQSWDAMGEKIQTQFVYINLDFPTLLFPDLVKITLENKVLW